MRCWHASRRGLLVESDFSWPASHLPPLARGSARDSQKQCSWLLRNQNTSKYSRCFYVPSPTRGEGARFRCLCGSIQSHRVLGHHAIELNRTMKLPDRVADKDSQAACSADATPKPSAPRC